MANVQTRKYEDLSEAEKMLRTLIYAIETRDEIRGTAYMLYKLQEAKSLAEETGIPLVELKNG